MGLQTVKPGDVVLYPVTISEKGAQTRYYAGEVVGGVSGGVPRNADGEPLRCVCAIYRRGGAAVVQPGRRLLARGGDGADEERRLGRELRELYGPGELIAGFSCEQCVLESRRVRQVTEARQGYKK